MRAIRVSAEFTVGGEEDLDTQTDRLMDELLDIEENTGIISDSTVSAALRDRTVEIAVTVHSDGIEEARRLGSEFIKQAIEAAGGQMIDETPSNQSDDAQYRLERAEQELLPA